MADPRFFNHAGVLSLKEIISISGASLYDESGDLDLLFDDVAPLDRATNKHVSFFDNAKYIDQFSESTAGVCFVRDRYVSNAPATMQLLICEDPYRAYALVAQRFHPAYIADGIISPQAIIDPTAKIGAGCTIEAGVVIQANVEIGDYCHIAANAIIHHGVIIGTACHIGAGAVISHAVISDRVIIHRNSAIGQDGFGFAMGRGGHVKVPQLGRVMIESDVEIGACTTIDRGSGPDTHIGQGVKIDNLVHIAHNVHVGAYSVITGQVGISGSTRIGEGVIIGGQAGLAGHLKIGSGVKLAARSGVMHDIPSGQTYGGTPAVPIKDWHRQTVALQALIKLKSTKENVS